MADIKVKDLYYLIDSYTWDNGDIMVYDCLVSGEKGRPVFVKINNSPDINDETLNRLLLQTVIGISAEAEVGVPTFYINCGEEYL
jgi:hypothetical protein